MISGDLLKEARLRAGITQQQLAERVGKAQPAIARWERGEVLPSLETLRSIIRACGFELSFSMSVADDSNITIIDEHLRMSPRQRFTDLMDRVAFIEQRELLTRS